MQRPSTPCSIHSTGKWTKNEEGQLLYGIQDLTRRGDELSPKNLGPFIPTRDRDQIGYKLAKLASAKDAVRFYNIVFLILTSFRSRALHHPLVRMMITTMISSPGSLLPSARSPRSIAIALPHPTLRGIIASPSSWSIWVRMLARPLHNQVSQSVRPRRHPYALQLLLGSQRLPPLLRCLLQIQRLLHCQCQRPSSALCRMVQPRPDVNPRTI